MSDRISLTIPRERPFLPVAHLVLGGVAVRHNLTVESLEDLQVALDELLDHDDDELRDVTVDLSVAERSIEAEIGPFPERTVRAATEPSDGLGLSRVLATVVDRVEPAGDGRLRLVKEFGG